MKSKEKQRRRMALLSRRSSMKAEGWNNEENEAGEESLTLKEEDISGAASRKYTISVSENRRKPIISSWLRRKQ